MKLLAGQNILLIENWPFDYEPISIFSDPEKLPSDDEEAEQADDFDEPPVEDPGEDHEDVPYRSCVCCCNLL